MRKALEISPYSFDAVEYQKLFLREKAKLK